AAFVVSGLDDGEAGSLTLSEGASSTVLAVSGHGTYTADLHTWGDGPVAAALAVSDAAGNTFTASTSIAIDPDFGDSATLSGATVTLGSAGASAAAFVVSGLDDGEAGSLTLSEGASST